MKVLCIDNDNMSDKLTVGKIYQKLSDVELGSVEFYQVVDDNGAQGGFYINRFKPLSDIREEKLNQIL